MFELVTNICFGGISRMRSGHKCGANMFTEVALSVVALDVALQNVPAV